MDHKKPTILKSGIEAIPFNLHNKCGAKTRKGTPCARLALQGKRRCQFHGGLSTGARTLAGKRRCARTNWKHGRNTNEAKLQRRISNELKRLEKAGNMPSCEVEALRMATANALVPRPKRIKAEIEP